jgi:hypothetical protein
MAGLPGKSGDINRAISPRQSLSCTPNVDSARVKSVDGVQLSQQQLLGTRRPQMQVTLEQCQRELARLDRSVSDQKIDALVDEYLVGSGTATAIRREELAEAYSKAAEFNERVCRRILRKDA